MAEVGIKNSWSLVEFARANGTLKVANFVNRDDGEEFKSCAFVDPNGKVNCLVGFSSNLGELTPKQIIARKNELQVVELNSGNYKLCASGADQWETVDLGLQGIIDWLVRGQGC